MTPGLIVHLVIGKANPERMNGVTLVAHNLATWQHGAGVDVEVWGISRSAAAPTSARSYRLRIFAGSSVRLRLGAALEAAIGSCDARTVFHLHGGLLPEFYAVTRELKRRQLAWVLTPQGCYDSVALDKRKWTKRAYIALLDRKVLAQARRIQALSQAEADSVRLISRGAKIAVVPNGQDVLEPFPGNKPRADMLTVGFCGRLDRRHKGLDLLVEAFAGWQAPGASRLWLIGDGEHREWLLTRARQLGLAERMRIFGALFGARKTARLRRVDVFIHCSRHEGLPTAMLDAAARGLPLIASEATHLADYIEEWKCGRVLAANTVEEIRRTLSWAADAKQTGELAELGRRARTMVAECFRWELIGARLQTELYQV